MNDYPVSSTSTLLTTACFGSWRPRIDTSQIAQEHRSLRILCQQSEHEHYLYLYVICIHLQRPADTQNKSFRLISIYDKNIYIYICTKSQKQKGKGPQDRSLCWYLHAFALSQYSWSTDHAVITLTFILFTPFPSLGSCGIGILHVADGHEYLSDSRCSGVMSLFSSLLNIDVELACCSEECWFHTVSWTGHVPVSRVILVVVASCTGHSIESKWGHGDRSMVKKRGWSPSMMEIENWAPIVGSILLTSFDTWIHNF